MEDEDDGDGTPGLLVMEQKHRVLETMGELLPPRLVLVLQGLLTLTVGFICIT